MTVKIAAIPYCIMSPHFIFSNIEEFQIKKATHLKKYGCEEYEFDFLDGDDEILQILIEALGNTQILKALELFEDEIFKTVREAMQFKTAHTLLGMSIEDSVDLFEDVYLYEGTVLDYANDIFNWDSVPDYIHPYIDIKSFAKDLEYGGEIVDLENGYLFIRSI